VGLLDEGVESTREIAPSKLTCLRNVWQEQRFADALDEEVVGEKTRNCTVPQKHFNYQSIDTITRHHTTSIIDSLKHTEQWIAGALNEELCNNV
jgi:hypothetical protein